MIKAIIFGTIAALSVSHPAVSYCRRQNIYRTVLGSSEILTGRNIIKFTPLKILGTYNPSIEVGYERLMGPRSGIQFVASWLLKEQLFGPPDYSRNFNGFMTAAEYRYYYRDYAPEGKYIAFECLYLKGSYRDVKYFIAPPPYNSGTSRSNLSYQDTIRLNKKNLSVNIKLGIQEKFGNFVIDFYAGLGINFKNIKHFDRIHPNREDQVYTHRHDLGPKDDMGRYAWPSVPLNLRIGYLF